MVFLVMKIWEKKNSNSCNFGRCFVLLRVFELPHLALDFRSLFTTQAILCRDSLSWRVSEVKQSRITFETQLKLARGNICFGFFLVTLSRECKKTRTRYGSSSDMNWSLNITEDRCSFLLWSSSLTSWSPSDGYGGYAAVEILPRSALWVRIYR